MNQDNFIAFPELLESYKEGRDKVRWGTRGLDDPTDREVKRVRDLSNAHLYNILVTQNLTRAMQIYIASELYLRLQEKD